MSLPIDEYLNQTYGKDEPIKEIESVLVFLSFDVNSNYSCEHNKIGKSCFSIANWSIVTKNLNNNITQKINLCHYHYTKYKHLILGEKALPFKDEKNNKKDVS